MSGSLSTVNGQLTAPEVQSVQSRCAAKLRMEVASINSLGMTMTLIPPGQYVRGLTESQLETLRRAGYDILLPEDMMPAHRIVISEAMLVSAHEVTDEQFFAMTGRHGVDTHVAGMPYHHETTAGNFPVAGVSWFDAIDFCNGLSRRESLKPYYGDEEIEYGYVEVHGGDGYRLLTEAEWEYCCRAGTSTIWNDGDKLDDVKANTYDCDSNTRGRTPVGTFPPNAFSLYDMHGNVHEWCFDAFDEELYPRLGTQCVDPVVANYPQNRDVERVYRGGSWESDINSIAASRGSATPWSRAAGIRVARNIPISDCKP